MVDSAALVDNPGLAADQVRIVVVQAHNQNLVDHLVQSVGTADLPGCRMVCLVGLVVLVCSLDFAAVPVRTVGTAGCPVVVRVHNRRLVDHLDQTVDTADQLRCRTVRLADSVAVLQVQTAGTADWLYSEFVDLQVRIADTADWSCCLDGCLVVLVDTNPMLVPEELSS